MVRDYIKITITFFTFLVALGACNKDREAAFFSVSVKHACTTGSFAWEKGDVLNINGENSFPLDTGDADDASAAIFSFNRILGFPLSAVFPASSYAGDGMISVPHEQKAGNPRCANIMAGAGRTDEISVYPLCGKIVVPVRIKDGSEDIDRIMIVGNGGEAISGEFSLSYNTIGKPSIVPMPGSGRTISVTGCNGSGDYDLFVPATIFERGFTLTVTSKSGKEQDFVKADRFEVKGGQNLNISEIEFNSEDTSENIIHTYMDMNMTRGTLNSHASVCDRSNMTFVGSSLRTVGEDVIVYDSDTKIGVVYPRFIQNSEGEYLMFFHYGVKVSWSGNNVAFLKSRNLLDWSYGANVLLPTRMKSRDGQTTITRCYAGPDVVKLPNGTLLLVTATRRLSDFQNHPEDGGLAISTSNDGGKTWSSPSYIFLGTCWEPKPIVRPDGRIEIYYTDATYVPALDINISGTSYVYSDDNGLSWKPDNPAVNHLHAFRQIRDDSVSPVLFTDQMPAVIALNGTDRLAAACESNMTKYGYHTNQYMLTMAYSESGYSWGTDDAFGVIPMDRNNHFMVGAAPQLVQFKSGETVLSFNKTTDGSAYLYVMTGDATARNFSSPVKAFSPEAGKGFWGGTYVIGSNVMLMAIGGRDDRTIDIGQMFLNHDIAAGKLSVWLDGRSAEWSGTEALFVGSSTPNQAILRSAYSADRLYFLAEVVGDGEVGIDLWLAGDRKFLKVSSSGIIETNVDGASAFARKGFTSDKRKGWSAEISLPLSILKGLYDFPVKLTISGNGFNDTFNLPDVSDNKLPHIIIR